MQSDYAAIATDSIQDWRTTISRIGKLLSEQLYADRGHFVFELLQNAEDAMERRTREYPDSDFSRTVSFALYTDRLECRHFGLPFTESDVRAVCDVMGGTKESDANQIGKFGIGFKSVFGITDSPEVHSGVESFRIRDYIQPEGIRRRDIKEDETLFVFPFDKGDIPDEAHNIVQSSLSKLNARALLFLRRIDEIQWSNQSGEHMVLRKCADITSHETEVELHTQVGLGVEIERWLLFQSEPKQTHPSADRVELAFLLSKDTNDHTSHLPRVSDADLVAFFPTGRSTNLGFLIQGPFNTTPARDNILDDTHNRHLITKCTGLLTESLEQLRDLGYLTAASFHVLPIDQSLFPLSSIFRPFYDSLADAFRSLPLLPTADGSYISGHQALLARTDGLRQLFDSEQLARLFPNKSFPQWLTGDFSRDSALPLRNYLIQELGVTELNPTDSLPQLLTDAFLEDQSDEWFCRLYALLLNVPGLWSLSSRGNQPLRFRRIIRMANGENVLPFDSDGEPRAYLPTPDGESGSDFPRVTSAVISNPEAMDFLETLGLRDPDPYDEALRFHLPKLMSWDPSTPGEAYRLGLLRVIVSAKQSERLRKKLGELKFLLASNEVTGELSLQQPGDIYVRTPELEMFFEGNPSVAFLADDISDIDDICTLFTLRTSASLIKRPPEPDGHIILISGRGCYERGLAGFDPECAVDGLDFAVSHPTPERAKFIWNMILASNASAIKGTVETSTTHHYKNPTREKQYSSLGRLVTEAAWLPDRSGNFRPPIELTLADLPSDFEPSETLALQLGMNSGLAVIADQFQMPPDLMRYMLESPNIREIAAKQRDSERGKRGPDASASSNLVDQIASAFTRPPTQRDENWKLPPSAPSDIEFRAKRTRDEIREEQEREPSTGERFRYVPRQTWEIRNGRVRQFFLSEYNGACQICRASFLQSDGTPYFEAVHIVSYKEARWLDRPGNALCLCPTCAAKFLHGTIYAEDVIAKLKGLKITSSQETEERSLPFELCGNVVVLSFSHRHLIDLQSLLAESDSGISTI